MKSSEHEAGREDGRKGRLSAIVLDIEREADGATIVTVLPITHSPPDLASVGLTKKLLDTGVGVGHFFDGWGSPYQGTTGKRRKSAIQRPLTWASRIGRRNELDFRSSARTGGDH